ncbi:hypothetical protein AK812_SmicGene22013 [Symbiodinium microadriaticum]|uniref:Uncharacterized protein n=1 Tax=Symbiodinium microadriaticum TaxID=2951 RepID=A0A1Q9DKY4_SYMMI|nr:hypothetical protein AK812_SmicGene22013 [Symbiodinium microadriaticum]
MRRLAAALFATAAGQDGVWLFRYFIERMDCRIGTGEDMLWDDLATYLAQRKVPSPQRLAIMSSTLQDVLLPFGVADPTVALGCALGTSAALQELATACVDLLGGRCVQRGLRLLHLSKLFMLFQFNDFGAWFSHSRWQTDMQRIATASQGLAELSRQDAAGGATLVAEPANLRNPSWNIGLVTYCNYNNTDAMATLQTALALLCCLLGAGTELPVVDLAKADWKEQALEALQKHASFYLTNHGCSSMRELGKCGK